MGKIYFQYSSIKGDCIRASLGNATIIVRGLSGKYLAIWISREPIAWPWCNSTAIQRRPYSASVNSHSPVGLLSGQWDAVDCASVQCDRSIHNDRASRWASSRQCACPFYSSRTGFFFWWQSITSPTSVSPPATQIWLFATSGFSRAKIAFEREEICDWDGYTVHKLSERCLTADWVVPWESDCWRMHSKVSSNWLTSSSRPRNLFSRYSTWLDTFWTALVLSVNLGKGIV